MFSKKAQQQPQKCYTINMSEASAKPEWSNDPELHGYAISPLASCLLSLLWPAASIRGHTHTHTCNWTHMHTDCSHSGGNVSQKSGVIIAVTRPWGYAEWRLGERTEWKRLDVKTRCHWEVRLCISVFVYKRKRDRVTERFRNTSHNWCAFYCVYCVWCLNTHDAASICVHECVSV